jgi:type VI secretion system secreted protein Hcp
MEQEYIFLKLGDIKGKATSEKFKDQIVLQNMSYGISQGGQWEEQNQLSGRITNFSDLSCVKLMDVASPSIATACATKQQFKDAVISVTSGTKDAYYKLTLEKVIVTSISTSISGGEAHPQESFTISFRKGTWEYGTAKGGYDLEANKKV